MCRFSGCVRAAHSGTTPSYARLYVDLSLSLVSLCASLPLESSLYGTGIFSPGGANSAQGFRLSRALDTLIEFLCYLDPRVGAAQLPVEHTSTHGLYSLLPVSN